MIINCVYSKNKLDFKKYSKLNKRADIINFNDITTKLIKNDVSNNKPSKYIINTLIRKKLQKSLSIDNNYILYALQLISSSTVDSIKELICELYTGEYEFNLTIINKDKIKTYINEDCYELFDNVDFIDV